MNKENSMRKIWQPGKRWGLFAGMACLLSALAARGDEGMWLFNNPPKKYLQEHYGFQAGDAWYRHVQQAALRFNNGGSGSFISADGLVMTNHHVGAKSLQELSTPENNLLKNGFSAKTPAEERKCINLELNVLQSIEDVTERINAAVPRGSDLAAAEKARRAAMNTVEEESLKKTGLRSDVVTLYHGGLYQLYRYKKYTDVRLVFAPEQEIAFFGGDPDNFEYPRYDLDVCFFRVYENGKPAKIEHYFSWNPRGVADGELVFVVGNPGHSDRLDTVAHLEFLRDRAYPEMLDLLRRRELLLTVFSQRSKENARRARNELYSVQNSRKARQGGLEGLQDPAVMQARRAQETALRQAVRNDPRLRRDAEAWRQIQEALDQWKEIYSDYLLLERGAAFQTSLFGIARTLVRLADETAKPNAERLREFRESNLESLRQELFSAAPIYKDLETVKLADSLSLLAETRGYSDKLVQQVLAGKSPQERAAELIAGTRLEDVAVRKRLAEGGKKAIEESKDPLIQLARLVDPPARRVREIYEQKVEEPLRQAYAKIAALQFALHGTDVYPDATFTLRLAFGVVKGYEEAGKKIPPWTTFAGLFRRAAEHDDQPPFQLPPRWLARKDRLDLSTPMNFVFTADIIGGNSGSPVLDRDAKIVGLVFDGNLESLVWDFAFTEKTARSIAVDSRALIEALQKVYDAGPLVEELLQGRRTLPGDPISEKNP
jgi:hypothetical protein